MTGQDYRISIRKKINEDHLRDKLVRENLWELWTRIKAEVDEYGP